MPQIKAPNRWAESDSDSDDDAVRVVKSKTDKRFEGIQECVKTLKNHLKNTDFKEVVDDLKKLGQSLETAKRAGVFFEGNEPAFFIKCISDLDTDLIRLKQEEAERKEETGKATWTKNRAQAFNTLKAQLRKFNKTYEDRIEDCRVNPDTYLSDEPAEDEESEEQASDSGSDSSSDSDSGSESDSDSESDAPKKKSKKQQKGSDSESGSDSDSDWSSDSDSSSESESDSDDDGANRWAAGGVDTKDVKRQAKKDEINLKKAERHARKVEKAKTEKKEKKEKKKEGKTGKNKGIEITEDMKWPDINKKLQEVYEARGRKGFDRQKHIDDLQKLADLAAPIGASEHMTVLQHLIYANFDASRGAFTTIPIPIWDSAYVQVFKCLEIKAEHPEAIFITEANAEEETEQERAEQEMVDDEDVVEAEGTERVISKDDHARAVQTIAAFVERLDDELFKSLQFTDVHSDEYGERLALTVRQLKMMMKMMEFFPKFDEYMVANHPDAEYSVQAEKCRLALRLIEQIYYKHDSIQKRVFDAQKSRCESAEEKMLWEWRDTEEWIASLAGIVYKHGGVRDRCRATLCQAFHHALHDRFFASRDLIQVSHAGETALNLEILTQILFNRVLTQLGLCAFRMGRIPDAHQCLMEVCAQNKARELLAQGLVFRQERTPEQEKAERRRQMPYHMHISLEVVETCHHISAMLLEIPNMARTPFETSQSRRRVISKSLRRHLEGYEKNFNGPPENPRETVIFAASCLLKGEWQTTISSYIFQFLS